jgi:exonuclease VII large subunit
VASARPAHTPAPAANGEPTLEDYDYDLASFNRAHSRWSVNQVLQEERQAAEASRQRQTFQESMNSYAERAEAFVEQHPDYPEAIDEFFSTYQPSQEIQLAIIGHERGPEIAYYVANNDDEAFTLANTLPQNSAAAVARVLRRMDAAQQAAAPVAANPLPAAPVKQVSQAPAPTRVVGGRAAAVIPPQKLTDDEWYKADREQRRKR